MAQPAPLTDDIQERVELARAAQDTIRQVALELSAGLQEQIGLPDVENLQFNLMQLSLFLYGDINILRQTVYLSGYELARGFLGTESFLAIFLQRHSAQIDRSQPDDTEDEDDRPRRSKRTHPAVGRGEAEKKKALHRDNCECVISHSIDPDVAHIWPFVINNRLDRFQDTRRCLLHLATVFGHEFPNDLASLFTPTSMELAASDRAWNLISLNAHIRRCWGKAYFGLRWRGITGHRSIRNAEGEEILHAMVDVEWCWLPQETPDALSALLNNPAGGALAPRRRVRLDTDANVQSVVEVLENRHRQPPRFFSQNANIRDQHGRHIESGRVFSIQVEAAHVDEMKRCIVYAWLAARMAALSGAAEVPYDLDRTPPDDLILLLIP